MFYVNFGDFQISGSSPEILVRVRNGTVTVRPIAGTLPRGATPEADLANEQKLLADPKERAEHLMLLDLGRNDVGRVSARGTVEVTESFTVERYSHVMHIVSNVQGQLKPGEDMVSALAAGFPAGTTSGAPKIRAMEIITELEPHARGVYAGGVGYFGAGGDMDTCIALRTAVFEERQDPRAGRRRRCLRQQPRERVPGDGAQGAAPYSARAEEAARYDRGPLMTKVLLVDNYDSFTYNLVHYLQDISPDVEVEVVRNDALTAKEALAKGADAIVLSPGPCTPDDAGHLPRADQPRS